MTHPFTLIIDKTDPKVKIEEGIVRKVFGSKFIKQKPGQRPESITKIKAKKNIDMFMQRNKKKFNFKQIKYRSTQLIEGKYSQSVRFEQKHNGIPVYDSKFLVGQSKIDGSINLALNNFDYKIPTNINKSLIKVDKIQIKKILIKRFSKKFKKLNFSKPKLFVYRQKVPKLIAAGSQPFLRKLMIRLPSPRLVGQTYVIWQIFMDTKNPDTNVELLIDAINGELIAINDQRFYDSVKGDVFWPDPIRSSKDPNLNWSSNEAILKEECIEVDLENLDSPINGEYRLCGKWVKNAEIEDPKFSPPTTKNNFKINPSERSFLNVMAYYYSDRLAEYLHSAVGIPKLNLELEKDPIIIDPQGAQGYDAESYFYPDYQDKGYIILGEGLFSNGVPDATDPGVIIHEYGHAIHHYIIGRHQNGPFEEGFCDFLSACWLDRYNETQFNREKLMLWQSSDTDWPQFYVNRRVDLDPTVFNFDNIKNYDIDMYNRYLIGDVHASALWQIFLDYGGNSNNAKDRENAANKIITRYIDTITAIQDNKDLEDIVEKLAILEEEKGGKKEDIYDPYDARGDWRKH